MSLPFGNTEPPRTVEEAIEFCQSGPTLRKIKAYLDSTSLSADLKALLYDLAGFTVKIGEAVVAIGRQGDPSVLTDAQRAREMPNQRQPLAALVAEGRFDFPG